MKNFLNLPPLKHLTGLRNGAPKAARRLHAIEVGQIEIADRSWLDSLPQNAAWSDTAGALRFGLSVRLTFEPAEDLPGPLQRRSRFRRWPSGFGVAPSTHGPNLRSPDGGRSPSAVGRFSGAGRSFRG